MFTYLQSRFCVFTSAFTCPDSHVYGYTPRFTYLCSHVPIYMSLFTRPDLHVYVHRSRFTCLCSHVSSLHLPGQTYFCFEGLTSTQFQHVVIQRLQDLKLRRQLAVGPQLSNTKQTQKHMFFVDDLSTAGSVEGMSSKRCPCSPIIYRSHFVVACAGILSQIAVTAEVVLGDISGSDDFFASYS